MGKNQGEAIFFFVIGALILGVIAGVVLANLPNNTTITDPSGNTYRLVDVGVEGTITLKSSLSGFKCGIQSVSVNRQRSSGIRTQGLLGEDCLVKSWLEVFEEDRSTIQTVFSEYMRVWNDRGADWTFAGIQTGYQGQRAARYKLVIQSFEIDKNTGQEKLESTYSGIVNIPFEGPLRLSGVQNDF